MKKVFLILGIVAGIGFLLVFVAVVALLIMIHRGREFAGQTLYPGIGMWTRIDEFAHAQGKTNYIAYADDQLALLREAQKEWMESNSNRDLSGLKKMQADAYATTDQNIKNGQNPLSYLDNTNIPPTASLIKGKQ